MVNSFKCLVIKLFSSIDTKTQQPLDLSSLVFDPLTLGRFACSGDFCILNLPQMLFHGYGAYAYSSTVVGVQFLYSLSYEYTKTKKLTRE